MPLRVLSRKERELIIIGAKEGDQLKLKMILESFNWLKKAYYNKYIYEKDKISAEDYYQECDVKIARCIEVLNEINYGSLSSLVKVSIKNLTEDIIRKNKRQNKLDVISSDAMDKNKADYREHVHNFDNHIIGDMVVYESYSTNIRHQLSPRENDIFFSHIEGESFEAYADNNGMNLDSVKRIFRNAIKKIRNNKEQIKKFHCIELSILLFLKEKMEYMDLLYIAGLIVG